MFDLAGDDENPARTQRASTLRWDRKHKKFIKGDGVGADNQKLIRTESGARLPATFRSGVYEEWKSKSRTAIPRVGEKELASAGRGFLAGKRFRHNGNTPAAASGDSKFSSSSSTRGKGKTFGGDKTRSSSHQQRKPKNGTGIKSVDQVTKERRLKANRTRRSTQPTRKKK
jgi:ATP-dependent RNA helicase DDX54/DBP10